MCRTIGDAIGCQLVVNQNPRNRKEVEKVLEEEICTLKMQINERWKDKGAFFGLAQAMVSLNLGEREVESKIIGGRQWIL